MKLGLICRPFSFHGGIETATAGLLGALRREGHAVELISTRRQPTCRAFRCGGCRSCAIPPRCGSSRSRWPPSARRRAGATIWCRATSARSARISTARARDAIARTSPPWAGSRGSILPPPRLRARAPHLPAAGCAHVVAISQQGKSEIEQLYGTAPSAVTLVYNGVDLERFHPDNARDTASARARASASRRRRGRCSSWRDRLGLSERQAGCRCEASTRLPPAPRVVRIDDKSNRPRLLRDAEALRACALRCRVRLSGWKRSRSTPL